MGSIGFVVATEDAGESACCGNAFGAMIALPGMWLALWGYGDGFAHEVTVLRCVTIVVSLIILAWPGPSGAWALVGPSPVITSVLLWVPGFRFGRGDGCGASSWVWFGGSGHHF